MAAVDFDDMQGLLRFGYKHHTEAVFVLLRVRDAVAARAWLATAPVADAVATDRLPETVLQLALSAPGLQALGVPDRLLNGFAPEFVGGLGTDPHRARRLGDIGANAPAGWAWGGPGQAPHVLALLYALPGRLAAFQQALQQQWSAGFELLQALPTSDLDGVEPFGFVDGISQPSVDWQRARPVEDKDRLDYTNLSCLGEFVLGYPNEYGRYTERPLLTATSTLPSAEEVPQSADLGRNGSYLVLRSLRQDVAGFWRFVKQQAGGDGAAAQQLAEAMVGRTMAGEPLAASTAVIEGVAADEQAANGFTYAADPFGNRCPLGAHVRRSNPRNADLPGGAATGLLARLTRVLGFDAAGLRRDIVASTRFHRLLRRGREYGPPPQSASADADRGLHFICLCADIARQFEFVQGAWLMGPTFDGLPHESDPLLGHREPGPGGIATDGFSMPQAEGAGRCLQGLPRFVTVTGGGYFFLPGLRALRYLASASNTSLPVGS